MPQTFAGACDRIMTDLRTLTWILQAPDDPPAAAVQFPFAAIFPGTFTSKLAADARQDLQTVHVEIHWTFRDLPRNTGDAKDRLDSILNVLWGDVQLNGTVDTIISIDGDFGPMVWGLTETLGFLVKITFKQRTAIT
jgi:hypothetical protein